MRRGQSLWIGAIFILSLLFLFEAPVIPVEGSQTFASACHKLSIIYLNWNHTDWQSVGYHFLGMGYSLRYWHRSASICGRFQWNDTNAPLVPVRSVLGTH